MSIEQPDTIDIIGTQRESNEVRLVITDHLSWEDENGHLLMLQEKLNTYIAFVESGQFLHVREPRMPPDPKFTVVVAGQHAPTEAAKAFLQQVQGILSDLGVGLLFEPLGD